jgi:uroporphyrinogen decarboxylase
MKGGFMTSKEIILKTINLEETPRLPVALLSAGAWTFNRKGISLEQVLSNRAERTAEIVIETNDEIKSDIVWPGSGYHNLAIRGAGGKIKFRQKGTPDVAETLIKDLSEIDKIKIERVKEDPGVIVLSEAAGIVSKAIGDKTFVGTSQWAPFTLAGLAYGVEKLMRNIYKDKDAVHAVLEFASELCYQYLEPFIDAGVSMISLADPTSSGDMISREQFKEFSLPYLKKLVERISDRGVAVIIHICGNITDRLDLIPLTGAKIISLDYKVDLGKAREILDGKIAFSGNLNPVAVMQNETPGGVGKKSLECIEKATDKPGYILMPGCDIPPTVPSENIQMMVETAHNFRNL